MPKPYYQDEAVTIYHADCRDILPLLELGSVDLVLTDPPYGISLQNHAAGKERRDTPFDIQGDEDGQLGATVLSGLRDVPTIAFASPMHPWPGKWRQWLAWDKGGAVGGGGDVATCWKQTWELIQVRNLGQLNGQRDSGVLRYWVCPQDSSLHPAQKPIELVAYLISKTNAFTILDPFMGSGTTLRAAKDLGRKAIGIEIEECYCEIAAKRMSQMVMPMEKHQP